MTKTWGDPSRSLTKAISLPSGENSGDVSLPGWLVSGRARPPSTGTVQTSPFQSKATVLPSGDRAGWFGSRIGSRAVNGARARNGSASANRNRVTDADSDGVRLGNGQDMAPATAV